MEILYREATELANLRLVLASEYNGVDTIAMSYKANINDTWIVATITGTTFDLCKTVANVEFDTTLIEDGSYTVILYVNSIMSAMEEIVIKDNGTEVVSSYEGVKIIG